MNKDDAIKDLAEAEVVELEDQDLNSVAGGGPNTNCGCDGYSFSGESGAENNNCGCSGGGAGELDMM